ncbi:MAG TPA: hypothetical protein VFH85_10080 [Gammaproteobacteria bacterium]|nr:hypothetical protein [Gammaproteobacteria bacterium]
MQSPDTNPSAAVGDDASRVKEQAKQTTREAVDDVRRQATETAERQKYAAAEQADSVAGAFRDTADQLDRRDQGWLAEIARRCADGADRIAGEMRGKDLSELIERTQVFARERPATFLAGAVAAGFLLTRFVKSSERRGHDDAGNGRMFSQTEEQSHASTH